MRRGRGYRLASKGREGKVLEEELQGLVALEGKFQSKTGRVEQEGVA